MTATAIASPACPKCGSAMYDNRLTKKNPKQPDFKCTQYKQGCEGVIWPPKNGTPPTAKSNEKKPVSYANKPEAELPEFLRDAAGEDAAELAAKLSGVDTVKLTKDLATYLALAEWYLNTIVPLMTKADVGTTPESVASGIHTLFIKATR